MRDGGGTPDPVKLSDYQPPAYLVETVGLRFDLHPDATRIACRLQLRRNPAHGAAPADLRLHGRGLRLICATLDGTALGEDEYALDAEGLRVPAARLPGEAFIWEAEVEVDPAANTALEGLYLSNGAYFTQCEPEGFRKIAFFPDRPDVMAVYEVEIRAPADLPVLLSNGDLVEEGALADGRRFARWRDPHPKPSYLFALVAGDLVARRASFTTASGRAVKLAVWVRSGDEDRAGYALDALIRSMRWDERVYGREYDLELFNIVATDDFNMGAMENKGLNIFNSRLVLASPDTATDLDYERIEAVIAHEYFHNWTGNRVTCRDWFQLCLKEGLTVFRDQSFTADERSAGVKRVADAQLMRSRQFREDSGPLAHPVRPEEYLEINNFYTVTIYEKGAEIVRMLHRLVGPERYRAALDLYFERHDGQAVTIEDFRACFEAVSGRDLSQFALWWRQAGTPLVEAEEDFADGVYTLRLRQSVPPTPDQTDKAPMLIPVALGLLDSAGRDMLPETTRVLELREAEQEFRIEGLAERPVASLLRGFSAPVRLSRAQSRADALFLLAHDSDPYTRWEAGRALMQAAIEAGGAVDAPLAEALRRALTDATLDPAFRALLLGAPGEEGLAGEIAAAGKAVDPDALHAARRALRRGVAEALRPELLSTYESMACPGPYDPGAADAGKRALRLLALGLLATLGDEEFDRAARHYAQADNMTDSYGALSVLALNNAPQAEQALADFAARWRGDPLVMDKWRAVQAAAPGALARVRMLAEDAAFEWRNPNRFRSLISVFAATPVNFHAADGAGYRFVADWLLRMDRANPQTAARAAGAFETWRRYDSARQQMMRDELGRIAGAEGLSKDMRDVIGRILSA